ncbi:sugar transferase [Thermaerobacter litoralis]
MSLGPHPSPSQPLQPLHPSHPAPWQPLYPSQPLQSLPLPQLALLSEPPQPAHLVQLSEGAVSGAVTTLLLALAHLLLVAVALWRTRRPRLSGFHVFLGLHALAYGLRPLLNALTGGYLLYGLPAALVPEGAAVSFLPPTPVEPAGWAAYNRGLALQLAFAAALVAVYGVVWSRAGSRGAPGVRGRFRPWEGETPDRNQDGLQDGSRARRHLEIAWLLSLAVGVGAVVAMHVLSGGRWLPGHRGGTTVTAAVPFGKILFPLAVIPLAASLPLARATAPTPGDRRAGAPITLAAGSLLAAGLLLLLYQRGFLLNALVATAFVDEARRPWTNRRLAALVLGLLVLLAAARPAATALVSVLVPPHPDPPRTRPAQPATTAALGGATPAAHPGTGDRDPGGDTTTATRARPGIPACALPWAATPSQHAPSIRPSPPPPAPAPRAATPAAPAGRGPAGFITRSANFDGPDVWVIAQGFFATHGPLHGRTLAALPARVLTPAARGQACHLTATDLLNTYRWRQFYWQTGFGFNVSLAQEAYLNFGAAAVPVAGALAGGLAALADAWLAAAAGTRPVPRSPGAPGEPASAGSSGAGRDPLRPPLRLRPRTLYLACAHLAAAAFTKDPGSTLVWTAAYAVLGAAIDAAAGRCAARRVHRTNPPPPPRPPAVAICRSNPVDPDPRVERLERTLSRAGYRVHVLGWNRSAYGRGLRNLPAWLGWQLQLFLRLWRLRHQIDVIHACDFDTLLPALAIKGLASIRPAARRRLRGGREGPAPRSKAVVYDIFDWYADTVTGLPGPARRLLAALDRLLLTLADAVILADERRLPQLGAARPRRLAVIYNSPDWEGEQEAKREGEGQPRRHEQPEGKRQGTTPSTARAPSHRAHQGKKPEGERQGESERERAGRVPRQGEGEAPGPRDEAGAGCRDWTQGREQRARPISRRAAVEGPTLRLAYVATLQPGRGLQELLAVLARHPEWHLDLAGFGPEEPVLRQAAEDLPNVRFHGRVSHAGCRELYARADVIPALYDPAIPNHRYASPSKVFEAMALGKPVIVARGTGIDRRVRRHRLGWVVPYGSIEALEAALTEAAGWTPARRRAFSRRARRLYRRRWGWPRMERRLLRLYRDVVTVHEEEVHRQREPFNSYGWGCTTGLDGATSGLDSTTSGLDCTEPRDCEPVDSLAWPNTSMGHPSLDVAPNHPSVDVDQNHLSVDVATNQSARPEGSSNPPPDSSPPVSRSPERRLPAPRTPGRVPRVLIGRHVSPAVRRHVLLWALGNGMAVDLIPDPYEVLLAGARWGQLDDMPLLRVGPLAPSPAARLVKRILDVMGSLALLVLFAWAFALIPLLIWLDDRGRVLYRQTRVGLHGRPFTILKFRTMVVDAERTTGPVWARQDDPRVTRIGRMLRSTHLDELPQLVNVLRGEMSLVGPRPERPELAARFAADEPAFRLREAVKPGLTGLAQVEGSYQTLPAVKVLWDLRYVAGWRLVRDIVVLPRTVVRILFRV